MLDLSFSLWLEADLEMKQAVNASFAAHLNSARIGLHNLKGTGVRRIQPGSRMGHRLLGHHIVVGQKGAYAMWDRDDNQWVPLPVNLHPAKEVLFSKPQPPTNDVFTHNAHSISLEYYDLSQEFGKGRKAAERAFVSSDRAQDFGDFSHYIETEKHQLQAYIRYLKSRAQKIQQSISSHKQTARDDRGYGWKRDLKNHDKHLGLVKYLTSILTKLDDHMNQVLFLYKKSKSNPLFVMLGDDLDRIHQLFTNRSYYQDVSRIDPNDPVLRILRWAKTVISQLRINIHGSKETAYNPGVGDL